MPVYSFKCNNPKCEEPHFEAVNNMAEAHLIPSCPSCGKGNVERDWQAESAYLAGPIKTVGSLMDKNNAKMSNDQKQKILDDYGKEQNKGTGPISPWKRVNK